MDSHEFLWSTYLLELSEHRRLAVNNSVGNNINLRLRFCFLIWNEFVMVGQVNLQN